MSVLLKELGKQTGLIWRLVFAFFGLFAPGMLMVAVVKGFLSVVEDLDDEELQTLVAEIQND